MGAVPRMARRLAPGATAASAATPTAKGVLLVHPADGPTGGGSTHRYVFVDMDNTTTRYGTEDLLPGALRFIHELRGDMDDPKTAVDAPKVMVLTARPALLPHHHRPDTGDSLHHLLTVDGQSILDAALHGQFFADCILPDIGKDSQEAGDDAICEALGRRKVENVTRWAEETRPGLPLVFVGDNGEGDVQAAIEMLRRGLIQHAIIRRVGPSEARLFVGKEPTYTEHDNLVYHDGYEEAAAIAQSLGLLSEAAAGRVVRAVVSGVPTGGGPPSAADQVARRLLFTNAEAEGGVPEREGTAGHTMVGRWVNRDRLACETLGTVRGDAERAKECLEEA